MSGQHGTHSFAGGFAVLAARILCEKHSLRLIWVNVGPDRVVVSCARSAVPPWALERFLPGLEGERLGSNELDARPSFRDGPMPRDRRRYTTSTDDQRDRPTRAAWPPEMAVRLQAVEKARAFALALQARLTRDRGACIVAADRNPTTTRVAVGKPNGGAHLVQDHPAMTIPFRDLKPQFLRWDHDVWHHVDTIGEAQGVRFLCPKCYREHGGPAGAHSIICWSRSRGVPDDARPGPGRWKLDGTGYDDLSLNADPPSGARSVLLDHGCHWHGFVTNGQATDA